LKERKRGESGILVTGVGGNPKVFGIERQDPACVGAKENIAKQGKVVVAGTRIEGQ